MKYVFVGDVIPEDVFSKISRISPSTNNMELIYIQFFAKTYGKDFYVLSRNWDLRRLDKSNGKCIPKYQFQYGNCEINTISFSRKRRSWNYSAIVNIYIELRRFKIENANSQKIVFIVNNPFYGLLLPVWLAKRKNDKLFTIVNEGLDARYLHEHKIKLRENVTFILQKILLRRNDGIITFCRNTVNRYAPKLPHISLIYACDSTLFNDDGNYEKDVNHITILYAGLIAPCYGLSQLMEGVERLPNYYKLVICGGGTETMVNMVKRHTEKSQKVVFKGLLPRKDIIRMEKSSDLLVMIRTATTPSEMYISQYCQPSKIPEYLLSGTPILATDIEGIPEELKPFLNFTSSNPEEIAQRIVEICENRKQIFRQKAYLGQLYATKNCTPNLMMNKMIDFIDLISNKN